jgi:hypothetical protein
MGNVLNLTNTDFSVVAWVKTNPGDTTQDTVVLSKHAAFSNNGYELTLNVSGGGGLPGKAQFYEGTVAGSPVSTTTINDGNWHQIVGVFRQGAQKLIYVDGSPAEDVRPSQPFLSTTAPFIIGGDNEGNPRGKFTGLIDEVQVYNHALTPEDVDFLYANPTKVVLECADALAQVNEALDTLTRHWQNVFGNSQFQIPGETPADQLKNLVNGIGNLNFGQQQALYFNLGGTKR